MVAAPIPISEELRILCPSSLAPPVYSFSVVPIIAASTGSLLLKFESTLFSVLSLCLIAALNAVSLIPLMASLCVPTLMHPPHLVRVLSAPFTQIGPGFSRMLLSPSSLPSALILALAGQMLSVPFLLVFALVGAIVRNPPRVTQSALPVSSASVCRVFVRHCASIGQCYL